MFFNSPKFPVTIRMITYEGFNSSVDSLMHLQTTPGGIRLVAYGAHEWLLSSVDSAVAFDRRSTSKLLAAIRTG